MSEVNTATKIQPIPEGSSFFIMSQTNRFLNYLLIFVYVALLSLTQVEIMVGSILKKFSRRVFLARGIF